MGFKNKTLVGKPLVPFSMTPNKHYNSKEQLSASLDESLPEHLPESLPQSNSDTTTLFSAEDEFGWVRVVEEQQCRKLYFDSEVEQGCLLLQAPLTPAYEYQSKILEIIQQWQTNNKKDPRILMLGLGAGTLAHQLMYQTQSSITVVELRELVIECAHEYFQLPISPDIEIIAEDAIEFCQDFPSPFDVVIVDIFDDQGEANQLNQSSFLESLYKLTNANGLLLFNLWQKWQELKQQPKQQSISSNHEATATIQSQAIIDYWHNFNHNQRVSMNRYNIASSQNLVLCITKPA